MTVRFSLPQIAIPTFPGQFPGAEYPLALPARSGSCQTISIQCGTFAPWASRALPSSPDAPQLASVLRD